TVIIQKAGDVIPEVVSVLVDLRTGSEKKFKFPTECPVCGGKVEKPEGEAIIRCVNAACPAREIESLIHFVSKKAFDIGGLGEKVVLQLLDNNLISDAADIFTLKEEDFAQLSLFKEKRTSNLILAIEKAKRVSLSRFLYALGIRHIGEGTSQDLAKFLSSHLNKTEMTPLEIYNAINKFSHEEINGIEGFGGIVEASVFEFFHSEKTHILFEKFEKVGIAVFADMAARNTALSGKKIVVTGSLELMGREEAKDAIKKAGGISQSDVSAKTDFLVCGKDAGSKLKRAEELGVKTLTEKEFLEMLV
ncbi:MAG: BRCT domain-containing protein, partial [Candidatus Gracilibacteria bacterium]